VNNLLSEANLGIIIKITQLLSEANLSKVSKQLNYFRSFQFEEKIQLNWKSGCNPSLFGKAT
jgi:hypothetical protein